MKKNIELLAHSEQLKLDKVSKSALLHVLSYSARLYNEFADNISEGITGTDSNYKKNIITENSQYLHSKIVENVFKQVNDTWRIFRNSIPRNVRYFAKDLNQRHMRIPKLASPYNKIGFKLNQTNFFKSIERGNNTWTLPTSSKFKEINGIDIMIPIPDIALNRCNNMISCEIIPNIDASVIQIVYYYTTSIQVEIPAILSMELGVDKYLCAGIATNGRSFIVDSHPIEAKRSYYNYTGAIPYRDPSNRFLTKDSLDKYIKDLNHYLDFIVEDIVTFISKNNIQLIYFGRTFATLDKMTCSKKYYKEIHNYIMNRIYHRLTIINPKNVPIIYDNGILIVDSTLKELFQGEEDKYNRMIEIDQEFNGYTNLNITTLDPSYSLLKKQLMVMSNYNDIISSMMKNKIIDGPVYLSTYVLTQDTITKENIKLGNKAAII